MSDNISVSGELSLVNLTAANSTEVLTALADAAFAAGWVKESFREAVIAREDEYPTAIPAQTPVALPHTDTEHVLKAGLAVATLTEPVIFGEMGSPENEVPVQVVVMMLVTDPSKQVQMLGKLIGVIQLEGWYERVKDIDSPETLASAFNALLAEVG